MIDTTYPIAASGHRAEVNVTIPLKSSVEAPYSAIERVGEGIVNLTDHGAEASRHGQLDVLRDLGAYRVATMWRSWTSG